MTPLPPSIGSSPFPRSVKNARRTPQSPGLNAGEIPWLVTPDFPVHKKTQFLHHRIEHHIRLIVLLHRPNHRVRRKFLPIL
jgi:hypothetical protein